jgi:hypothetical protein
MERRVLRITLVVALLWPSVASSQSPAAAPVEDIVIARSWRESRVPPTAFCSRPTVGFGAALYEDRHTFRSVITRASDGRVIDANAATIGDLHACYGSTSDSARTNFYAEGRLSGVEFVGRGECVTAKTGFPETGLTVIRCFLDLGALPREFVGGQLTTNTIGSRATLGGVSDPVGYTQPSIATVRLWRRR